MLRPVQFLADVDVNRRALASVASFVCFAAGLVLVSVGAYLLHPAAGLVVAGVSLVACSVLYERAAARKRAHPRELE
jgi:hypothetical protein